MPRTKPVNQNKSPFDRAKINFEIRRHKEMKNEKHDVEYVEKFIQQLAKAEKSKMNHKELFDFMVTDQGYKRILDYLKTVGTRTIVFYAGVFRIKLTEYVKEFIRFYALQDSPE